MKQYGNLFNWIRQAALAILLGIVLGGCRNNAAPSGPNPYGIDPEKNTPTHEEMSFTPNPNDKETREILNNYEAVLEVSKEIRMGTSGTLSVWIGLEEYMPKQNQNTVRDTTSLYSIRPYARITPYAPDFKVNPEEARCVKIDPTGSMVLFTLTPEKKGNFEVSARIDLFDNDECSGVPFPKNTQVVSVKVTVDYNSRLAEIWAVFWDGFLRFWKILVPLVFGALIFVIRRFIKKKTGYGGDGNENKEE